MDDLVNTIQCMDALELCALLPDASVDMILCDLPYGTTACSWDNVIPFEPMWAGFKRIIQPRGAIVLTASQPFTSALVMSNPAWFRYDLVWHKTQATGHLNANIAPMREHESILIFGDGKIVYYPQMMKKPAENIRPLMSRKNTNVYGSFREDADRGIPLDVTYPRSVIKFANPNHGEAGLHPTQKPVALFEYLICTYTQEGETVFDPCVGSGTTALAAHKTGRKYICGDFTRKYVEIARKRLQDADPYQPTKIDEAHTQLSLFQDSGT